MSYTLQSIIGPDEGFHDLNNLKIVQLNENLAMIPLTDAVLEKFQIPFLAFTDEGLADIPSGLNDLCLGLSKNKLIIYVEAEYFGGMGAQASLVWRDGKLLHGLIISENAINEALRVLGIEPKSGADAFSRVGLDRHRHTNSW